MSASLAPPPAGTDFPAALLPALLAVSPTGVCLLRPVYGTAAAGAVVDFALDYVSPAARRMLRLPAGDTFRLLSRFPYAQAGGLFAFFCEMLASDEAGRYELNYQADGLDAYFHVAALRQGKWLVVSFTDPAEHGRNAVEEALRQSQAREQAARRAAEARSDELHRLFEQAPAAIAICRGPDLVVEVANAHMLRLWGLTAGQVVGQPLGEALPEARSQGYEALLTQALRSPTAVVTTARPATRRRADRAQMPYYNSVYQPLPDEQGAVSGVLLISTEVTEQVLARRKIQLLNEELAAANAQLRASNAALEQRVAERTHTLFLTLDQLERRSQELTQALAAERELGELKSRFVTMASHEFRTPLAVVLSAAELVSKYAGADQQAQRLGHLARIRASVKHLNEILEEFLSVGRLEEGKAEAHPAPLDLPVLLAEVVADLRGTLKAGQTIVQRLNCPGSLHLDASLLRKILLNLLSNASKYSGENAGITVGATCRDQQLIIRVQDQGVGIAPEDQAHLFERFFRARNAASTPGTGLGLYIIARYLELMGGTIVLESTLHVGTTFTLSIPYANHSAD